MDGMWATGQHLILAVEDRGLKPLVSGQGKTGSVIRRLAGKKTGLSPRSRASPRESGGGGCQLFSTLGTKQRSPSQLYIYTTTLKCTWVHFSSPMHRPHPPSPSFPPPDRRPTGSDQEAPLSVIPHLRQCPPPHKIAIGSPTPAQ
jgi:hypothetical protein